MKKAATSYVTIITMLLFCSTSCVSTRKIERNIKYLEANATFDLVYNATRQGILKADLKGFDLESIEVKLGATTTKKGQAGAKLFIVSGKYSKAFTNAKTATFTFKDLTKGDKSVEDLKFSNDFINYLYEVLLAAKEIKPIQQFGLSEFVAEVEFTITKSGESELELELSPVTPSLNFSKESEYAHSVSVTFKRSAVK